MIQSSPSLKDIRAQFPGLHDDFAFFENAGGSQVPACVIDEVGRFYREDYAQKGASYAMSLRCTELHDKCKQFMNRLFGGESTGHVAVGPSATALFNMLAGCFRSVLRPGDEIIISLSNHESHASCWERLLEFGVVVKYWQVDPLTGLNSAEELIQLVNEKTKLICFSLTCNLVGDIADVEAVVKLARSVGATTVLDAVAAASHQALDVEKWGVDFCCISCYKVYGPHLAALWGKSERWEQLSGPNHKQLKPNGATTFELGCLSYESMAGFLAVGQYLGFLSGSPIYPGQVASREIIERAFSVMGQLEREVSSAILQWLNSRDDLRILGMTTLGESRHPTFSFVSNKVASDEVVRITDKHNIALKYGHFYAWRLCEAVEMTAQQRSKAAEKILWRTMI